MVFLTKNCDKYINKKRSQYDFDIYTNDFVAAVWNQVATAWDSYDEIWNDAGDEQPVDLLYSDRAWVSGSNESSITTYISANENGTYTTYNG